MLFIPPISLSLPIPKTKPLITMKRDHQESSGSSPPKVIMSTEDDAGVDELLAALGYKVRSSDMADVALKLEQLDMAIGTTASSSSSSAHDDSILSHLASETTHYNPSDLSTWLESMLSELNTPPPPPPPTQISSAAADPSQRKRMRTMTSSFSSCETLAPLPLVVVADPQEAGIRLIYALMACAEAIQRGDPKSANSLLKQISFLAASQAGAMRKVAGYFAEALARRIYRRNPHIDRSLDSAFSDILHMHFYESCPYLKFAHFTANQAILEAFSSASRTVHVVDLGINQGMQWPALMQALALRPGGPPTFRLTGIGPPQPDNPDALQQVGWKLAQLAETINVEFQYRAVVSDSLADLEQYLLGGEDEEAEAVAVNSVFELHRLLAQPGSIEKVLETVRKIRPKALTIVEQEANHNAGAFAERFTEALHYYSTMFDSVEGGEQEQMMTEMYLGREICNVVACEGPERTERHETLVQWKGRLGRAGFEPVHIGSNAFKQASMLLALFSGGDGYRVEERDGCLTLGWHTRPLIATSAWRLADV